MDSWFLHCTSLTRSPLKPPDNYRGLSGGLMGGVILFGSQTLYWIRICRFYGLKTHCDDR
jgi:hypothetical protein